MRIAVAGATGNIGSLTVDTLTRGGHDAVGLSRSFGVDLFPHILIHALPELRPGIDRNTGPPLHVRRTICWRCAARRSAFIFAITWKPAEVTLCPRHLIWLGLPVRAHHGRQYDVHHLPDILHAQRRHYRLV